MCLGWGEQRQEVLDQEGMETKHRPSHFLNTLSEYYKVRQHTALFYHQEIEMNRMFRKGFVAARELGRTFGKRVSLAKCLFPSALKPTL